MSLIRTRTFTTRGQRWYLDQSSGSLAALSWSLLIFTNSDVLIDIINRTCFYFKSSKKRWKVWSKKYLRSIHVVKETPSCLLFILFISSSSSSSSSFSSSSSSSSPAASSSSYSSSSSLQMWSGPERLLALDELIDRCETNQVKHMMQVIEPQFQRDFISLLPKEVWTRMFSVWPEAADATWHMWPVIINNMCILVWRVPVGPVRADILNMCMLIACSSWPCTCWRSEHVYVLHVFQLACTCWHSEHVYVDCVFQLALYVLTFWTCVCSSRVPVGPVRADVLNMCMFFTCSSWPCTCWRSEHVYVLRVFQLALYVLTFWTCVCSSRVPVGLVRADVLNMCMFFACSSWPCTCWRSEHVYVLRVFQLVLYVLTFWTCVCSSRVPVGPVCADLPGSQRSGSGGSDLQRLEDPRWRQPAVEGEVSRGR